MLKAVEWLRSAATRLKGPSPAASSAGQTPSHSVGTDPAAVALACAGFAECAPPFRPPPRFFDPMRTAAAAAAAVGLCTAVAGCRTPPAASFSASSFTAVLACGGFRGGFRGGGGGGAAGLASGLAFGGFLSSTHSALCRLPSPPVQLTVPPGEAHKTQSMTATKRNAWIVT